jgi:hypothetical protein
MESNKKTLKEKIENLLSHNGLETLISKFENDINTLEKLKLDFLDISKATTNFFDEPTEKPTDKPTEKPIEKPTEKPTEKPEKIDKPEKLTATEIPPKKVAESDKKVLRPITPIKTARKDDRPKTPLNTTTTQPNKDTNNKTPIKSNLKDTKTIKVDSKADAKTPVKRDLTPTPLNKEKKVVVNAKQPIEKTPTKKIDSIRSKTTDSKKPATNKSTITVEETQPGPDVNISSNDIKDVLAIDDPSMNNSNINFSVEEKEEHKLIKTDNDLSLNADDIDNVVEEIMEPSIPFVPSVTKIKATKVNKQPPKKLDTKFQSNVVNALYLVVKSGYVNL